MHHAIQKRKEYMRVGNFLGRYAHGKAFLDSVNLEVSIIAFLAFDFLPRDCFVGIPCPHRYTFVADHDNPPEFYFLVILEALHRFLQQGLQCELRDFPCQVVRPANALA
jgi:hypothetical protein